MLLLVPLVSKNLTIHIDCGSVLVSCSAACMSMLYTHFVLHHSQYDLLLKKLVLSPHVLNAKSKCVCSHPG